MAVVHSSLLQFVVPPLLSTLTHTLDPLLHNRDGDVLPSFILMDVQDSQIITYVYQMEEKLVVRKKVFQKKDAEDLAAGSG